MSTLAITVPAPVTSKPRLVSPALTRVFLAEFGALTSLYLLLSVVPRYVGGASGGLTTGVLMVTSVVGELVTPRLVARYGYRAVLVAGLVLLGVPALALPMVGVIGVVVVCVVRGAGLAIIFVVCGGLGAALIPAERRGEGLGVFGAVVGVPAIVATPLGVWLADRAGYPVVFVTAAVSALAALAAVRGLPDRVGHTGRQGERPFGVLAAMRTPSLSRVSLVFAATAVASGVVITFLPVALPRGSGDLAALALLVNAAAGTVTRWWAGRFGDRHGARRLLVPGIIVAAAGMLTLVAVASPVAVVVGMVLVGAGFGVVQNVSMALMLERVPESGYDAVSALWSVAYDSGFGLGALAVGIVVVQAGYPAAFAVTGALVVAAVPLVLRYRPNAER